MCLLYRYSGIKATPTRFVRPTGQRGARYDVRGSHSLASIALTAGVAAEAGWLPVSLRIAAVR